MQALRNVAFWGVMPGRLVDITHISVVSMFILFSDNTNMGFNIY
jgi:hypothetical protein